MEIKRTTETFIETSRQFIIRQSDAAEQCFCSHCGEPMLAAEQIAQVFGISQRRVFQLVETSAAHYAETETGAMMLCVTSLAEALGSDAKYLCAE